MDAERLRGLRAALFLAFLAAWRPGSGQQPLQDDLGDDAVDRMWMYDDWERARELAAREGKPLLAVFRCVP
jgi:hypothetical protein